MEALFKCSLFKESPSYNRNVLYQKRSNVKISCKPARDFENNVELQNEKEYSRNISLNKQIWRIIMSMLETICWLFQNKLSLHRTANTARKVSKYGVFSGPWIRRDTEYLSVFRLNAGKYWPEKALYFEEWTKMGNKYGYTYWYRQSSSFFSRGFWCYGSLDLLKRKF